MWEKQSLRDKEKLHPWFVLLIFHNKENSLKSSQKLKKVTTYVKSYFNKKKYIVLGLESESETRSAAPPFVVTHTHPVPNPCTRGSFKQTSTFKNHIISPIIKPIIQIELPRELCFIFIANKVK